MSSFNSGSSSRRWCEKFLLTHFLCLNCFPYFFFCCSSSSLTCSLGRGKSRWEVANFRVVCRLSHLIWMLFNMTSFHISDWIGVTEWEWRNIFAFFYIFPSLWISLVVKLVIFLKHEAPLVRHIMLISGQGVYKWMSRRPRRNEMIVWNEMRARLSFKTRGDDIRYLVKYFTSRC